MTHETLREMRNKYPDVESIRDPAKFGHLALKEPIINASVPKDMPAYSEKCNINISISWDMAMNIASIAAPILNATKQMVDSRLENEKARDIQNLKSAIRLTENDRGFLRILRKQLIAIHKENLHYDQFCNRLGHYFKFSHISKKSIQKLYKRFRTFSMQRKVNANGLSVATVADQYATKKSTVYSCLKSNRRNCRSKNIDYGFDTKKIFEPLRYTDFNKISFKDFLEILKKGG